MEDAMAAGAWPEKENPNTTRINEIIDYVKQVRCQVSTDRGSGIFPSQISNFVLFRFPRIKRF